MTVNEDGSNASPTDDGWNHVAQPEDEVMDENEHSREQECLRELARTTARMRELENEMERREQEYRRELTRINGRFIELENEMERFCQATRTYCTLGDAESMKFLSQRLQLPLPNFIHVQKKPPPSTTGTNYSTVRTLKLKQENVRLRRERDHNLNLSNQNYEVAMRNGDTCTRQQQEIEFLNENIAALKNEVEEAKARASRAVDVQTNLYGLLESSVVKRKDKGGTFTFPTGEQIVSNHRCHQNFTEEYFFDLVNLLALVEGRDRTVEDHLAILEEVLLPAAEIACRQHQVLMSTKEKQLEDLIEDKDQSKNQLVQLFMASTMQRLVRDRMDNDKPLIELDVDTDCSTKTALLDWAMSEHVTNDEEMDNKTIGDFIKSMKHLLHQCQYSDPPCFLYPAIGERVSFKPEHHTQRITKTLSNNTKKLGRPVRVLFPGLYFEDPEQNPKAKPIEKAIVLLVEEAKEIATSKDDVGIFEKVKTCCTGAFSA